MYFNHVVETYQEYQQTLAHLNEHAESDWHKLSQAVRDDVIKEIEEMLAWSIFAASALKKEKPVRKRQPRKGKVVEEPKAEADLSL